MQNSTVVIHYICSPSMLDLLTGYAACSKDLANRHAAGRASDYTLQQGVELISFAAQSNGRLRLFLKDGREIRARLLTEEVLRDVFPWISQDELLATLDLLKQPTDLPLKSKTGLFAPLEHSAS